MKQRIAVLGATGSIGDSTLALLAQNPERFEVYALSGYQQLDKLFLLCQQFCPKRVAVASNQVDIFSQRLQHAGLAVDVVGGADGLINIAQDGQVDTVVAGIVGSAGLPSTLSAVQAGKRVLLANKESLVMAGALLMRLARQNKATLLPIDSEHNAIFQCLPTDIQQDNQKINDKSYGVKALWLTASGGPFLTKSFAQMQSATVAEAVKHPNWSMGQKISVDSATMMNKGLELIEACHLFALPEQHIHVVIHPQSIIHSLVQYGDGSFLAQLGSPDMKTPIAHALAYPERINVDIQPLSLFELQSLEFIEPDLQKFACLRLARQAMQSGNVATVALNASNEVAVSAFLQEKIRLTDIALINEQILSEIHQHYTEFQLDDVEAILQTDKFARKLAKQLTSQFMC